MQHIQIIRSKASIIIRGMVCLLACCCDIHGAERTNASSAILDAAVATSSLILVGDVAKRPFGKEDRGIGTYFLYVRVSQVIKDTRQNRTAYPIDERIQIVCKLPIPQGDYVHHLLPERGQLCVFFLAAQDLHFENSDPWFFWAFVGDHLLKQVALRVQARPVQSSPVPDAKSNVPPSIDPFVSSQNAVEEKGQCTRASAR
jgi:hypothetical protein